MLGQGRMCTRFIATETVAGMQRLSTWVQVLPDSIKGPAAAACTALSWAGNLVRHQCLARFPPCAVFGPSNCLCSTICLAPLQNGVLRVLPKNDWFLQQLLGLGF